MTWSSDLLAYEVPHDANPYGGDWHRLEFPNGYGVSVIRNPYSYGNEKGLFELAVFQDGHITYATPLTQNVIGYLTWEEVEETARAVMALPKEA